MTPEFPLIEVKPSKEDWFGRVVFGCKYEAWTRAKPKGSYSTTILAYGRTRERAAEKARKKALRYITAEENANTQTVIYDASKEA